MTSKWVQEECSHFHWLLTHLIRKKTVFANHTKTGVVTAQLMITTKIEENLRLLPDVCTSWWFVAELASTTCFLASGLNNDFLHICVNIGAGQLCVKRSARTTDQRFCCRFIRSRLPFNEISYIWPSDVTA